MVGSGFGRPEAVALVVEGDDGEDIELVSVAYSSSAVVWILRPGKHIVMALGRQGQHLVESI
jgi:hypothetical protein